MSELQRRAAVRHFATIGAFFKQEINRAAARVGLAAECYGTAAHPGIRFAIDDEAIAKKVQTLFIQENARRGVILATGLFLNCAHDEEAVIQTARVAEQSFAVIARALDNDSLDAALESPVQEELFRRLVR